MSDTKNIEILNISRAVSDEQEESGRWSDFYVRNDGTYMRLCNNKDMITITVNVKSDRINVEMNHRGDIIEESIELSATALKKTINDLYDNAMTTLIFSEMR